MKGISRRFLIGWLIGIGLGLLLSATSVATEPGAGPEAEARAAPAEAPPAPTFAPPEAREAAGVDVAAPPSASVTLIGTVELATSKSSGERVVQIVGDEQRTLIVDEIGAGRVLVKHEGERVSATGIVSLRKDGREVIEVSSFRPLGE